MLHDTQLKVHLSRLVDLELLLVHRGESGAFTYELAWRGETGDDGDGRSARFLVGLTDPATLGGDSAERSGSTYDGNRSGSQGPWSGPGRGLVGGWSAPGRTTVNGSHDGPQQDEPAPDDHEEVDEPGTALIGRLDVGRGA